MPTDAVTEAIERLRSLLLTLPAHVAHAGDGLARFYGEAALFSLQRAVIALEDFAQESSSAGGKVRRPSAKGAVAVEQE